jgi:preprotein translocase subunit SecE
MALTKKQHQNSSKKHKNQEDLAERKRGKRTTGKKTSTGKENKSLVKKDSGKKEPVAKKESRIEQVKKFVRGAYNEMKKVHWPTRREVVIYTGVVLVAVSIVGIMIWIFDFGLSSIFGLILTR